MTLVTYSSVFDATVEELFDFHADVTNLARISPPFPRFELLSNATESHEGDAQVFRLSVGVLGTTWHARLTRVRRPYLIEDVQEAGPFRAWRHQHRISPEGDGRARLKDVVSFRLLPTPMGEFIEYFLVRPGILGMFALRHRRTAAILREHHANHEPNSRAQS